jgi:DNA-binding NarL/FixJ family response regulator
MPKTRLVLCDDHGLILEGLRRVLEPEFEIAGLASCGTEVVQQANRLKPDIVLLDISMPGLNGIEAAPLIRKAHAAVKLVYLSQKTERSYVDAAFRAGASGYLVKGSMVNELAPALRAVAAGEYYISPSLTPLSPGGPANSIQYPEEIFGEHLTPRQRDVLRLVAEGKTAKEIAGLLGISTKTVEFHKAALMDVLMLRTTAELTRYALKHGVIND